MRVELTDRSYEEIQHMVEHDHKKSNDSPAVFETILDYKSIIQDPTIQCRLNTSNETIEEYASEMRNGAVFPPITVFHSSRKGEYVLADGFHRLAAIQQVHGAAAQVRASVRLGGRRDALRYSLKCNSRHGLRMTKADKRNAVTKALKDPEWQTHSNYAIADLCGVSEKLVRIVRAEIVSADNPQIQSRTCTRNGTTYEMKTPSRRSNCEADGAPAEGAPAEGEAYAPSPTPASPPCYKCGIPSATHKRQIRGHTIWLCSNCAAEGEAYAPSQQPATYIKSVGWVWRRAEEEFIARSPNRGEGCEFKAEIRQSSLPDLAEGVSGFLAGRYWDGCPMETEFEYGADGIRIRHFKKNIRTDLHSDITHALQQYRWMLAENGREASEGEASEGEASEGEASDGTKLPPSEIAPAEGAPGVDQITLYNVNLVGELKANGRVWTDNRKRAIELMERALREAMKDVLEHDEIMCKMRVYIRYADELAEEQAA